MGRPRLTLSERNPKLAEIENAVAECVTPELIAEALVTAREALQAVRIHVPAKGEVLKVPDFPVRLKAVEIILSWGVGKPVERQMIVSRNETVTTPDHLALLAEGSPEFKAGLVALLQRLTGTKAEPEKLPADVA